MNLPHTVELFKEQKKARVEHTITPSVKGRVFYEGTYWPAGYTKPPMPPWLITPWMYRVGSL